MVQLLCVKGVTLDFSFFCVCGGDSYVCHREAVVASCTCQGPPLYFYRIFSHHNLNFNPSSFTFHLFLWSLLLLPLVHSFLYV